MPPAPGVPLLACGVMVREYFLPSLAPVSAPEQRAWIGSGVDDARFIHRAGLMFQTRFPDSWGTDFSSGPGSESFQLSPPLGLACRCGPNQALLTTAYIRLGWRESCETWFTSHPRNCGPSTLRLLRCE
jgi:hypothetical protein